MNLKELITLGVELGKLSHSHEIHAGTVLTSLDTLKDLLPRYGLTSAVVSLQAVNQLCDVLRERNRTKANWHGNGTLIHLKNVSETVLQIALNEASKTNLVIARTDLISNDLRELPNRLKFQEDTAALHKDTLACIQVEAWRPAAVMAWNMAYDALRWWTFLDEQRLIEFNSGANQNEIVEYHDFFELGERLVLDRMKKQSMLKEKRHRAFVEWLDFRNDFAHPNYRQPGGHAVVGKIHELADLLAETLR